MRTDPESIDAVAIEFASQWWDWAMAPLGAEIIVIRTMSPDASWYRWAMVTPDGLYQMQFGEWKKIVEGPLRARSVIIQGQAGVPK